MPKAIISWEKIYTNFKNKTTNFRKTNFKMPFICTRHTTIQAFQYKIIHRTLPCNGWLNIIKMKPDRICLYCNKTGTIIYFLIDCNIKRSFWKCWARWWQSMTNFDMTIVEHIHESILFGFPGTIVINYCVLHAKQYIHLEKLKNQDKNKNVNIDCLGYMFYLKYTLKMEKTICLKNNNKLSLINLLLYIMYENLKTVHYKYIACPK